MFTAKMWLTGVFLNDDDDHVSVGGKNYLNRLGGGDGVRNDKVVTSNLAFARETPYISLSHCWNNIFVRLMKNGEDKQCWISDDRKY